MVGTTSEGLNQMQGIPLPQTAAGEELGKSGVEKFQASKVDLLNATYPKAVVDSILNEGELEKCKRAPTQDMACNPKDTVVSYHFDRMNLHQPEPGPWPQYEFMSEQCESCMLQVKDTVDTAIAWFCVKCECA
ncbi:hypothetical protein cypCar_00005320 [Cyprinus carpio]|nr:hypothetical protein cypCar_00005320 [Cyprinus carpio]